MSAYNGFQANPDDIKKFEQEAGDVASQIPGLPNRYSSLYLREPPFGGADFPAAGRIAQAHAELVTRMTENIRDLADQATDFGNGAGNAASGYSQTAQTEADTMNQFQRFNNLTSG